MRKENVSNKLKRCNHITVASNDPAEFDDEE